MHLPGTLPKSRQNYNCIIQLDHTTTIPRHPERNEVKSKDPQNSPYLDNM